MLKKLLFFEGGAPYGAPPIEKIRFKYSLRPARLRRAIWRENPDFRNFQIFENVKKLFQQVHYMKICSVGILDNDVLHLWMNPHHS